MLSFASKFAYIDEDADNSKTIEVELAEEDMSANLSDIVNAESDDIDDGVSPTTSPQPPPPAAPSSMSAQAYGAAPASGFTFSAAPAPPKPVKPTFSALKDRLVKKKVSTSRTVRKQVRNIDTNIFSVKLGFLAEGVQMATGDPTFCECGVALCAEDKLVSNRAELTPSSTSSSSTSSSTSSSSDTTENNNNNNDGDDSLLYWKCSFCQRINSVDLVEEERPKEPIIDYVLEVPSDAQTSLNAPTDASVVFCIDISGSMCMTTEVPGKVTFRGNSKSNYDAFNEDRSDQYMPGQRRDVTYLSRLQGVQAAIDSQLATLKKQSPNQTVGLVTFSNEVTIVGDGTQHPEVVTGDKLNSLDELRKVGEAYKITQNIGSSQSTLSEKVFALEEGGATALGPALVIATTIAAQKPGSRVVICTDGLANIGLGSMDSLSDDASRTVVEQFYEEVALYAQNKGVTISVISIRGAEANLEQLGRLADLTGGEVNMVDPLEITSQFSSILAVPLVATHVNIKLLLTPWMFARDQECAESSSITRDVGNATGESEVTFEYGIRENAAIPSECTAIPVQVQIHYRRLNGMKCVRVITNLQPVTRDRTEAERSADIGLLSAHAVKQAAVTAQKGDYTAARLYNANAREVLQRAVCTTTVSTAPKHYASYMVQNNALEGELHRVQLQEQSTGVYHDSAPLPNTTTLQSRSSRRTDTTSNMLWQMKATTTKKIDSDESNE